MNFASYIASSYCVHLVLCVWITWITCVTATEYGHYTSCQDYVSHTVYHIVVVQGSMPGATVINMSISLERIVLQQLAFNLSVYAD